MLKTSEIPLISSIHGLQRREERSISKYDLQAAIKYGEKEPGFPHPKTGARRWKYSYGCIVYVTDESSTREITSWFQELVISKVNVTSDIVEKNVEAISRIRQNPKLITSHLVLVVDMSGSMRNSDMMSHKSRSHGVYYNIAEQIVATQLHSNESGLLNGASSSFTDVVTLIEMRDYPTVIIDKEPISWILYNKLADLANDNDTRSHGNYLPAISKAFNILEEHQIEMKVALSLFFFSDGRPSDKSLMFPNSLYSLIREKCCKFGERLNFSAFGFGKCSSDFAIIKSMLQIAESVGVVTEFAHSYRDADSLRSILQSTSNSLTASRTLLSRLDSRPSEQKVRCDSRKRDVKSDDEDPWIFSTFNPCASSVEVQRSELRWIQKKNGYYTPEWCDIPFCHLSAKGFAVSDEFLGEGSERVVFYMHEVDASGRRVGPQMVAKESLYKHARQELMYLQRWHKTFAKTQLMASKLANKFNQRLDMLGVCASVPRIQFLPCSVYTCWSKGDQDQFQYAYLCEELLDPPQAYRKWNDNKGGIDGIALQNKEVFEVIIDHSANESKFLDPVREDEDEDEVDSGDEDNTINEMKETKKFLPSPKVLDLQRHILECDIPQAFTHFTDKITCRKEMVCDLQGILTQSGQSLVFKFTDPCIHSANGTKFGRTDHGNRGKHEFYKTHQCNPLCEILGIANGSKNTKFR